MNGRVILALFVALATGTAIAFQSMLSGRTGGAIGPIRTGLLVNAVGGSLALVFILIALLVARTTAAPQTMITEGIANGVNRGMIIAWVFLAGLLGIVIIGGVSFSVSRVGVTAGLSAIIVAQLLAGLLIDRIGGAGGLAFAITPRRLIGVAAMAVGVWLLVPRSG